MASQSSDFFVPMVNGRDLEFRVVWPFVTEKKSKDWKGNAVPLDKQKYEITLFFPKTAASWWECRNYLAMEAYLMTLVVTQWGQWPGQVSSEGPVKWPITDCDLKQFLPAQVGRAMPRNPPADYLEKYPWAAGHFSFRAISSFPPKCVDATNNDMAKTLHGGLIGFKGGDYVFASLNCFTYDTGTQGISFGFEGIKKTRDGEPIGGGGGSRSAEQMFGAPSGQPVAYGQPQPPLPPQFGNPTMQIQPYLQAQPAGAIVNPHVQPYQPSPQSPIYQAGGQTQPPMAPPLAPPGNPVAPPQYGAPARAPVYPAPQFGQR
jgi:hypothetical protein